MVFQEIERGVIFPATHTVVHVEVVHVGRP